MVSHHWRLRDRCSGESNHFADRGEIYGLRRWRRHWVLPAMYCRASGF